MRKILLLMLVAIVGLSSCKKDGPIEKDISGDNDIEISSISQTHTPVSVGQQVVVRAFLKEKDATAEYAWDIYHNNKLIDELDYEKGNAIRLLTSYGAGDYKIVTKVKAGKKTGEKPYNLTVVPSDFGIGAWGNSDSVIIANKLLSPVSGLIGITWVFESPKPTVQKRFEVSSIETENYLFADNKLVGGYNYISDNFITTTPLNVLRNLSYSIYLSRVNAVNNLTGVTGVEKRVWREGVTDAKKLEYENHPNGYDGIGYAIMNRDLTISTEWKAPRHHVKAYIQPLANNSKYEILVASKKADY